MKKSILIATLMYSFINAFPQNILKTYSGEMKTPQDIIGKSISYIDKGNGAYSYYELADGQRIKQGKFRFSYNYVFKYSIVGQYDEGEKVGEWVLSSFEADNIERDRIIVTYKNDILNGSFNSILYNLDPLPAIKYSGSFKNGHYIGDIEIETPISNGVIKGSFNESGWAHGKWLIERKKGIPLKQEREYYEGFLIKVIELDLSSGEKTVLFELPESSISDIKNTLNIQDSTLTVSGEHYKRIQNNQSYDDIDSRLFPNISGGKSLLAIFSDRSAPFIAQYIPLINGFSKLERNNKWYDDKRKEERLARELQEAEEWRIKEEKQKELEMQEEIEEAKLKELRTMYKSALMNNDSITRLYTKQNGLLKSLLDDSAIELGSIKKPKIFKAYKIVYDQLDKNDADNIKNVIAVQMIVIQLLDKKTKDVEKTIEKMQTVNEISSFLKNDAINLSK